MTLHIEPYEGRTARSVRSDLEYIICRYGPHPAFYRHRQLPLIYIYDSYLIKSADWAQVLKVSGQITIRHTDIDAIVIGLLVKGEEKYSLKGS